MTDERSISSEPKAEKRRVSTGLRMLGGLLLVAAALVVGVWPRASRESPSRFVGPDPTLLDPDIRLIPVVSFSTASQWPEGKTPDAPSGFVVTRFAAGLDHPRWLHVLPNGDVLVAESSTVQHEPTSLHQIVGSWLLRKAVGGSNKASANRITLLRDSTRQGVADTRTTFLADLHQPFGMELLGDKLYVGDTDALLSFDYTAGATRIDGPKATLMELPAGGYNNHWTRNIIKNRAGTKLYVTVGSGSDHAEHGVDNEIHRADILELDPDGKNLRVFASGLRNPVGLDWAPGTETLWAVVNERDMLGNDLAPDYLTSVREGGFYGWPYSYWGGHKDPRVQPERPDLAARAMAPDYALGNHVAPLGLAFYTADRFPERYRGGAFIAEHGSWNRKPFAGYKVVYVPFRDGRPAGPPEDFLTGFMPADEPGTAYGRPVGVAVDRDGSLLIADDVGDCVWRVEASN
jgi:glucose/arabinose dehydrogenase